MSMLVYMHRCTTDKAMRVPALRTCVHTQDKNAAPLNQLDVLMEETYEHIMELTDKVGSQRLCAFFLSVAAPGPWMEKAA